MEESEFDLDMDELSSAEDFLDYFGISFEPSVVHVNRLHILQRFHDYIAKFDNMPEDETEKREVYGSLLEDAYHDFVNSDAQTEKVFKVFRMNEPQLVTISMPEFTKQVSSSAS
jgi:nitrogenase-stabilizing/protective protein